MLQDEDGQVIAAHSMSAGLDYPGVGPEHSWLRDTGRVSYTSATDSEALDAFQALSRLEGIIPALETAHAIAWVRRSAGRWGPGPAGVALPERQGRQGRGARGGAGGIAPVTAGQPVTEALPAAQVAEFIKSRAS